MAYEHSIQDNIKTVHQRVVNACKRVGRDPADIQIIPVTKTVEPERISEALKCGFSAVAENRVQEAEEKIEQMGDQASEFEWHFIGHLQSNKVNNVVRLASMIQSIDLIQNWSNA